MSNRTALAPAARAATLLVAALSMLLATAPAGPVRAASSVEMQVRALVGGRYEVSGWAAVSVTLVNPGEPTQGTLVAESDDGTVQRFVEMPAGARKVVTLYVRPSAFQRQITVSYEEPNGTVEAEAEVRAMEQSTSQVAIVGDGNGALRAQIVTALDESAPEPIGLGPADLPERPEPLDGISSIVWAADSASLTEAQRRTIESWVAAGGELVVVGGADWQARTEGFSSLLPLTSLAAFDSVPHAALATWSGSAADALGADTVSAGPLHEDARALVTADDGTVLLSMRPVGAGRSILVGTDLGTETYRAWEGGPRLWSRVVTSSVDWSQFFGSGMPPRDEILAMMGQALGNLPALEVPPAELLLGVIVGYILLIGPISYLVLRRIDRREAAWITAPALVILFTACSYGIGNAMKGSDVIANQIALIYTSEAGGVASVQTYAGIFSPTRSAYDVRVDAEALLAPVNPSAMFGGPGSARAEDVAVEQGNPARLNDLAIGVFGFKAVRADAVVDYTPALTVSWAYDEDILVGTVTNAGETPLEDVAYVSNSVGEMVGDLEPGESAEFRVPRGNFQGSSASDQVYGFGGFDSSSDEERRTRSRRQTIDALVGYAGFMGPRGASADFGGRGPYVIGWRMAEGPVPIEIEELVTQRYAQAVEVLAVQAPPRLGEVTVSPGEMSISVVESEGNASAGGGGMMMIGDGSVVFAVTLPLEASDMEVTEVEVVVGPDPYMVISEEAMFGPGFWPPGYTAEIRDPRTGEWVLLGDLGQDSTFELEDPAAAISPAGRIEVRISGTEDFDPQFGQASFFVSASVSGVVGE